MACRALLSPFPYGFAACISHRAGEPNLLQLEVTQGQAACASPQPAAHLQLQPECLIPGIFSETINPCFFFLSLFIFPALQLDPNSSSVKLRE